MTMLTASEVAKQLGISDRKIYELAASRRLASHRFGGAVRFAQEDVDAYVKSCRVEARQRVDAPQLKLTTRNLYAELRPSALETYFAARRVKPRRKPP